MPDQTLPSRPMRPSSITYLTDLGRSHATATRDEETGIVAVSIGSVDVRVVLGDAPGVLLALLSDASEQIKAIFAGGGG
jgi:uncharacterized protein (DUF1501 family)